MRFGTTTAIQPTKVLLFFELSKQNVKNHTKILKNVRNICIIQNFCIPLRAFSGNSVITTDLTFRI